jgi:hypothetical protein
MNEFTLKPLIDYYLNLPFPGLFIDEETRFEKEHTKGYANVRKGCCYGDSNPSRERERLA